MSNTFEMAKTTVEYRDMDVKDLEGAALLIPYEKMEPGTADIAKGLLMDAVMSAVTGPYTIPKEDFEELSKVLADEPKLYRPVWPQGAETGLEMAGFLNGYCVRYSDWGDDMRMETDSGGHPADQLAAILTLLNVPGVTGKKVVELVHLAYQLWVNIMLKMMYKRENVDRTTMLALTVPILAAVCNGDGPERVQNALNLSAIGGTVLHARPKDITNLKNGATGYAIARALWCYRMSGVLKAPGSTFTGKKGWYHVIASLDGELKGMPGDEVYNYIEIKAFPCSNPCQGATECAVSLHSSLVGKLDRITRIVIRKDPVDADHIMHSGQRYPDSQPSADHHIRYCIATGLKHGTLTPKHYSYECLHDESVHHLIDLIELELFTADAFAELGGKNGACVLEVYLDDGAVLIKSIPRPGGALAVAKGEARAKRVRELVEAKRTAMEQCYGFDLTKVAEIVYNLEKYDAKTLLDTLLSTLKA